MTIGAGEKSDIGVAKEDISLIVTDARMDYMEATYAGNGASSNEVQSDIGRTVIQKVVDKYATNNQIGKATITVDVERKNNLISDDAIVTISTANYEVEGTIKLQDGILTWGEIEPNIPRIVGLPGELTLNMDSTVPIIVKVKGTKGDIIWNSSVPEIAKYENGAIVTATSITNPTEEVIITATADGCETKTCIITVIKSMSKTEKLNDAIGEVVKYPRAKEATSTEEASAGYSASYEGSWRVFYADDEELFIIPTAIIDFNGIPINRTQEANGSLVVAQSPYGKKFNEQWLKKCEQINSTGEINTSEAKKTNAHDKAVAYLCNSSNWDSYIAKTVGTNKTNVISGSYAVGGPTIELLVKAWNNRTTNATPTTINNSDYVTVDGYDSPIKGGIITNDILKLSTENEEGLFNPSGTGSYWLASPISSSYFSDANRVLCVEGTRDETTNAYYSNGTIGVRPLVSIPVSNVTITGTTGNYIIDIGFGVD